MTDDPIYFWLRKEKGILHLRKYKDVSSVGICGWQAKEPGGYEHQRHHSYPTLLPNWRDYYLTHPELDFCPSCIEAAPEGFTLICERALKEEK